MQTLIYLSNILRINIVNMKTLMTKYWLILIGIILGALVGFLYWKFVGCNSGNCPITASPLNSSIWGAVMGGLLLSTLKRDKK